MKKFFCVLVLIAALSGITAFASADFTLCDIYKTPAEFEKALQFSGLEGQAAELMGKLSSPQGMAAAIAFFEQSGEEIEKLYAYSYLSCAADTRDAGARERYVAVRNAASRFDRAVAPLREELAALKGIDMTNDGVLRVLSPSIAFPSEVASIVLNADFNAPLINRPDGSEAAATYSEFARAMSSTDAAYRKRAYEAYHSALSSHRNTLAASMEAHFAGRAQQAVLRDANVTHEQQTMISRYQMPPKTADVLLSKVFKTASVPARSIETAAKRQGRDKLAPYEVEPVSGTEAGQYSLEQAKNLVLASLQPLGAEYLGIAKRILESGHINAEEGGNKQSGAFCVPAGRTIDPYIHLNFDGSISSVSTLAHELGHAVHFVLSRKQPSVIAQPSLAVTETAAIFNEILLARYLLREAEDNAELECAASAYASLLGGSFYNQTRLFAFERSAYNQVQKGGALTADKLDALWTAICKPFWGGYADMPESAGGSWASVPHLYRDYYVINYAFSAAAAETFADSVLENGAKNYLSFLSAGSSQPAYDLFCSMGVDFLREQAYNDVIGRLNELYDILEVRISNAA